FHNALISEEFDPAISIHENISDTSSPLGVAVSVFNSSIDSLSHTKEMLESENLEDAVNLIVSSKTVFLFGLGGSNIIAADAYHKLLRSPLNVKYASDYHLQLMEASRATKDDCAIIFSHTGRCKEAIQLADLFQQIGGRVLVITSDRNSPLARRADVTLLTISEETSFRSESLASRIVQLALIDSLYTSVMLANPRKSKNSLQSIRDAIELTR
ncbi:MAG: MurR/RpiR family transcriptional regulator, partial [Atopobium sp.]|nr:MurR/RpiR family transcriptional regulator [Atopobium sp.]